MIQEFGDEHRYDNHFEPHQAGEKDYVLHFRDGKCLARVTHVGGSDADAGDSGEVVELPRLGDYPSAPAKATYLFSLGEDRFFLAFDEDLAAPAGFGYESVNWLRRAEPQHLLFAAATASQLSRWYQDNRFCGRCGHATEIAPSSREIVCPECAHIVYPKICPGIICAVTRLADDPTDDAIVLTRYAGRTTALWALVAGFTEIGEPLEDTVRREVMEEVGLSVKNLRFYKSQPWGFTDTLLVGFWCEVDGDPAITVDRFELKEARWFTRDEIPLERTNDRASLTGEMIERFRTMGRAAWE
ncbi:NAD(+) diphosphatase [Olsenella sp. DSM 107455]|uniref:NAD(+) diphosphatase n=1 Tax=Thermophilibacter gallinarum TaxID=2779357 RepID=A0ABR9QTE4_9ACTN|nr:NAD(+) diphosphatase [Thermophilibacter gallinarum]MBE5024324.1 NAD(+) diphosphatase [Thermophilibacter gallinarum]